MVVVGSEARMEMREDEIVELRRRVDRSLVQRTI